MSKPELYFSDRAHQSKKKWQKCYNFTWILHEIPFMEHNRAKLKTYNTHVMDPGRTV